MAGAFQSKDRRALAVLAAAVVLFLLLQADVLLPRGGGSSLWSGSVEAAEQRLMLAQAKTGRGPRVDARRESARKSLASLEQGLLTAEDAALADAEMRQLMGNLLTTEGITMRGSSFGRKTLEGEDYAQAPLIVDFDCRIEQLVNLMAAMANAPQLLTTRRMLVRPGNQETKSITVRMTVSGYLPAARTPELIKNSSGRGAGR